MRCRGAARAFDKRMLLFSQKHTFPHGIDDYLPVQRVSLRYESILADFLCLHTHLDQPLMPTASGPLAPLNTHVG